MLLAFVAAVCAGLFAGAAIYFNAVEPESVIVIRIDPLTRVVWR